MKCPNRHPNLFGIPALHSYQYLALFGSLYLIIVPSDFASCLPEQENGTKKTTKFDKSLHPSYRLPLPKRIAA